MATEKLKSLEPFDYEILIRKIGDNQYSSYCPQLNYLIKGFEHEQVRNLMKNYIDAYIESLKSN
jgi:hypothetical protein